MINKSGTDVVKKIDATIDKVESLDLSDLIKDTFNPITDSEVENVDEVSNKDDDYTSLLNMQKNNSTIDATDLKNNELKVGNLNEISDPSNDKNYIIKKTTLGMNGEDLDYSTKKTYNDGTIIYLDKEGNKVKIVNPDGTVTINGKTIQKDGSVVDPVGRIVLKDGSSYRADDSGINIEKSDGTEYFYDTTGKLTKVVDKDGNSSVYNYDESGKVTTIEVNKKEANADGSYRTIIYNSDGSYSVTDTSKEGSREYSETTNYDKDGKTLGRDTTTYDGPNGEIIKESGNTKYVYNSADETLKYKEETNGNITTKTYYYSDGTVDKEETIENGKVTQTISKYSNGDYVVTDENGDETEYYANGSPKSDNSGGVEKQYYDNGNVSAEYNSDGSSKFYDESGNLTLEKNADGSMHSYNSDGSEDFYDSEGNHIQSINPDGTVVDWR